MKTDIMIEELVVGQVLFSTVNGEVIFKELRLSKYSDYPIVVLLADGSTSSYSIEGKLSIKDEFPELFKVNPFKENERVIFVRDSLDSHFLKRVLIKFINNKAVCWSSAETVQASQEISIIYTWNYWQEIYENHEFVDLTFQDISNGKGVGVDPKLIRIIS